MDDSKCALHGQTAGDERPAPNVDESRPHSEEESRLGEQQRAHTERRTKRCAEAGPRSENEPRAKLLIFPVLPDHSDHPLKNNMKSNNPAHLTTTTTTTTTMTTTTMTTTMRRTRRMAKKAATAGRQCPRVALRPPTWCRSHPLHPPRSRLGRGNPLRPRWDRGLRHHPRG